jgi:hypothetical protein
MNAIRTDGEGTAQGGLETPRQGDVITPRNLNSRGLGSITRTVTPTNDQGKEEGTTANFGKISVSQFALLLTQIFTGRSSRTGCTAQVG